MRIVSLPSPNHGPRAEGTRVELLVLHYTGMPSAEAALSRLTDPASGVSAHYTVDEDGTVYAHVAEERRAWHAGAGSWRGAGDVNSRSIGIEIVNPGHEFGYRPFPEAQMDSVIELARAVMKRWELPARAVLGHSDTAPDRKTDPGELFDWRRLVAGGVGSRPAVEPRDRGPPRAGEVADLLTRIGYDAAAERVTSAFQRRWRPSRVDGRVDAETLALMRAVAREYAG